MRMTMGIASDVDLPAARTRMKWARCLGERFFTRRCSNRQRQIIPISTGVPYLKLVNSDGNRRTIREVGKGAANRCRHRACQ